MKAIVLEGPGTLRVEERPVPEPERGQALVRVLAGGVCGTDLASYRGSNPLVVYPLIPGHELCGEVVEVRGDGPLSPEDRVVVDPVRSCGRCRPCRLGRPNCCEDAQVMGVHRDGGWAEYFVTDLDKLFPAPRNLPPEEAALCEPYAVGAHANERGEVGEGEGVVVVGAGTVGLAALQVAKARGARVLSVDLVPRKLELALRMGADAVADGRGDVAGAVERFMGGEGPDVVIEAVGRPETMRMAVELAAPAGRVVAVGVVGGEICFPGPTFHKKELDFRGSRNSLGQFPEVVRWMEEGKLSPGLMITHRFPIEEAEEALKFMDEHPEEVSKVVLL